MLLKSLKISGFKSFAKSTTLDFPGDISAIVGPNGSGKSNVVDAVAWVLGEQSVKSLRGKKGQDLIFSGSPSAPKTGKASVSLSFSKPGQDEDVLVSRTVYKDGLNEYSLNNSRCRLKDIVNFLGEIGLGSSAHHIINQGEADRILNASLVERRQMIEDALGLRTYQVKRDESKRKLERTEENVRQIQVLQKEIQPHLRFLKKQVDKAAKADVLKDKLRELYSSYFSEQEKRFKTESEKIVLDKKLPEDEFLEIQTKISDIKNKIAGFGDNKQKDNSAREKINLLERDIGGCEVMIFQSKNKIEGLETKKGNLSFDFDEIENFLAKLKKDIEVALEEEQADKIKAILNSIKKELDGFSKKDDAERDVEEEKKVLRELEDKYNDLLSVLKLAKEEEELKTKEQEKSISLERELYQAEIKLSGIKNTIDSIKSKESEITIRWEEMKKDLREAEMFLGEKIVFREVDDFQKDKVGKDWRDIERAKIRLEESGNIGEEVSVEYQEITKRDEFLTSELGDLEKSAVSLKELIQQMEEKININFKNGLLKINEELERFFGLMFGGGKAELKAQKLKFKVEDEEDSEENTEEGIDISVNLPGKKISSLGMLSGGERALTSIALLFAISQVNPPPFLILDETDASLDESNSRKYAKLLKDLSKHTQLILVTHNRETMEAAKILYGVTMDGQGVSRLLSIKLEEAEQLTS